MKRKHDPQQDEADILRLIHKYNYVKDRQDFQGWVSCFTVEGTFEVPGRMFSAHGDLKEYQKFAQDIIASSIPNPRHFTTTSMIVVNGDSATGRTHLLLTSTDSSGTRIAVAGEYEDDFVRVDGEWLIKRRREHPDGVATP